MSLVSAEALARLLAGLDSETRLRFLRDLWTARGRETDVADGDLRVTDPRTGERRTIRLVSRPGEVDEDVDAVVVVRQADRIRARARALDVGYVGPRDIRNLLLYGLDRERGDALFREYFDRPLDTPGERDGPTVSGTTLVGAVVFVALVFVAAAVGLSGMPPTGDAAGGAETTADATVSVTPVQVETETPAEMERTPALVATSLGGQIDPDALARRHVAALEGRSYRWVATFRGTRDADGRRWVRAREVVAVGGPRHYLRNVSGALLTPRNEVRTVRYAEYADAEAVYSRTLTAVEPRYNRRPLDETRTADAFARASGTYVERYLATTETNVSEVVVGKDYLVYRIEATGTPTGLSPNQPGATGGTLSPPFGNVTNYTAIGYVDQVGVVFSLTVRFTVDGDPVTFAYDYEGIGSTGVEPPPWYAGARNATGEITGPEGQ